VWETHHNIVGVNEFSSKCDVENFHSATLRLLSYRPLATSHTTYVPGYVGTK